MFLPRPHRLKAFAVGAALTAALGALSAPPAASAAPTTWYLDCAAGSGGSGSQATPWNSLAAANAHLFGPGDQLLLKRGSTCTGTLKPQGSGTAGAPVTLAAYGPGSARPVVAGDAATGEKAAVHLYNVEQWEIRDLEITFQDTGAARKERNGLLVEIADLPDGVGTHYVVDDVHVHDVNGDNGKFSNGIQFRVSGATTPTNFDDVLVQNSRISRVDREGLTNRSTWMCRPSYGSGDGCGSTVNWRASTRIVFRGNTLNDIGGDGIVVRAADHALVEHNTAYDLAMRPMGSNAGIWTINSDRSTIQYNEVHHVRRLSDNNDGMAFDSDYGNTDALFQYNHSHDNEGGFMLFCGACGAGSSSTGTVVRYNLSSNDRTRWLFAVGEKNARMYNNTAYLPPGSTAPVIQQGGGSSVTRLSGNIFSNLGTGGYSGWGGNAYKPADFSWDSNVFHGNHPANEPADPRKVTADPGLLNPGGSTAADYRLGVGSPARGAGATVAANGGLDWFGSAVPAVCRPDIGFHQASSFDDAACSAADLVGNPGFETGALAPWTWYGGAVADPAGAHTGGFGVRVGPSPAAAEQVVTVAPNTTYRLSGWGRVSATGTEVSLGAKQYDAAGSSTRAGFTATTYALGSTQFTTGPGATTARIYCYARSGTGYGYCDDITLVPS
ncbi:right-handed parallel beta-helix repeat-containing protein [Kitasatospora sp. NBC_00240]|uniref:right-handed parallel beta-helix repeat-containing protein n=1 Tax=Kitasatospora sp. NBC_00240 TaxID=2903567 RepID=UPI002254422B|nr:carbohydrate binding domain-containing protein [Kitasatospora sp. NBC_00240]MCX5209038.1 right-handed parallel beta-helix repeat-containing protein [Kitasatospora sp. NBC_00240]